jgi:phenylpropionate dioxygenase-like ring-hydroxylating dioxygenase large terminal subunit
MDLGSEGDLIKQTDGHIKAFFTFGRFQPPTTGHAFLVNKVAEFVEAQKAAYMETCIEDDEIAERMDAGRKALLQRGDNEVGPYQSPMEDGMQHFHEWYRSKMDL